MTPEVRNAVVDELLQRIDADMKVNFRDYCIGEEAIREVLEQFRINNPIPEPELEEA